MTFLSERLTILNEHLAMPKLNLPTSVTRRLLAYIHGGEMVRDFLPKFLRISAVMGSAVYVVLWLQTWSTVYREFERWGLVKAFFAQMLALLTVFLVARITLLRAKHLEGLPADDFVVLRAMSVLCRWCAETALVLVVGMGLSSFLEPLDPILVSLGASPEGSSGAALNLVSDGVSLLMVLVAALVFLVLYSIATAIDLSLAIEFNTRSERAGKESL